MDIAITGCTGRMGQELIKAFTENPNTTLSGALERPGHPAMNSDASIAAGLAASGVLIGDLLEPIVESTDAIIDFSSPENTLRILELAAHQHKIVVIGTTGFTEEQKEQIHHYAQKTPVVWSANMSVGVNVLLSLTQQLGAILDDAFDIEIVEMHHRYKVDAPSGTALALGEAAAKGREVSFQDTAVLSREGITGEREKGSIGFATLRGGMVVGDHSVIFASDDERIEVTHKSSSRAIYAKGALKAALWAEGKEAGLYTMHDVLALS